MLIGVGVLLGGTLSIATAVNANPSIGNNSIYEINSEEAKKIMLNKVPGAKVINFYLDNDNSPEYEGKLIKNNKEYEISIDAKTGAIVDFSEEVIKTSSSANKNNTNTAVNKPIVNQNNTNNSTVNNPIVNQNISNKYFDYDRYDNDIDDRYDDDRYDY